MRKNNEFTEVFSKFGEENLTEDIVNCVEAFVCTMFNYSKLKNVNEARYAYFEEKCKPKVSSRPMDCIKAVDPSMFPPCKPVLLQQIKRAWFIARLYKNATEAEPLCNYTPLDYGWELSKEKTKIQVKWFEGDQVPFELEELSDDDENAGETDEEYDEADNFSDNEDEQF